MTPDEADAMAERHRQRHLARGHPGRTFPLPLAIIRRRARSPWVKWLGGPDVRCERCGQRITLPGGVGFETLDAFLAGVIAEHADCPEPEPKVRPLGYW